MMGETVDCNACTVLRTLVCLISSSLIPTTGVANAELAMPKIVKAV